MSKKLQVWADPVVVNFFEMHLIQHKKIISKQITSMALKHQLHPTLVFLFLEMKKKNISKKISSMGSKHQSYPTLVFFFK